MADKKTAVIIGAGIGGITTAVFLAKNGYEVNVFEKNPYPGGRCSQIKKEGHRFDLGATMLLMPGIYQEVFADLGLKLEIGKDIFPLEDLYKVYFDDGSHIAFTTDQERMREQHERFEPGSFERSRDYVRKGYGIFRLGMDKLISRNFYHLFQMINLRNIPMFLKLKVFISNWNYATRFFKDTRLLMAYTFQNIYVGQSPFNSPALFSMVPAAELTEGSFFPEGGMFGIVQRLLDGATQAGVKFHYGKPVREIKIRNDKAEGVIFPDGSEVKADIVVCNADLPYIYRKLLPDKKRSAHIDKLKYSASAICYHWGLDKEYPQLGHHSVFLSDHFREGLDKIFIDKTVNDHPSFYVHAPARTDKSAAPAGHDTLSVVVGAGHVDPSKDQDWDKIKENTRKAVIERLKKAGLDDIDQHIRFEICHTPANWEEACNVSRGSVFGSLGHNILQMGYFRPHNRHDKYRNIYFTGGSTHPGNGIPNILMSSKLVTERILKENQ